MSIGSNTDGGASGILVSDLSIDGSDNGLRIKSNSTRGGLVKEVLYHDVCIRGTANPIYMDTSYSAHASDATGRIPVYRDILLSGVRVFGGGKVTLEGYDAAHRLGIQFDNVAFDDAAAIQVSAKHADVAVGPGPFALKITGEGVTVTGTPGAGQPNACADKFVPFPMP
jgi:polygalacturonase